VFWLKKLISFWLMPVPFCLALLVAGLLLARGGRRQRLGLRLCAAAAALLILFSSKYVSTRILLPLEDRYPPVPEIAAGGPAPASLSGCGFVAVLGAGHYQAHGVPATSELSTSALGRIVEAVRLLRALPRARLVVSGPGEPGQPSHGAVLAAAAESLGVDPSRITVIDQARDTDDEAKAVARIAGTGRVALVTSAWHMPRAAALFRKAGVDFVPCPADFVARVAYHFRWDDFPLDSESLERSTLAVHEWLGLAWARLLGAGR
jgi:uncharacterized SAM-binding protein YcdF (DUF218 family)